MQKTRLAGLVCLFVPQALVLELCIKLVPIHYKLYNYLMKTFLLLSFFVFAGEPDNFTGRSLASSPQNQIINSYIQSKLQGVVTKYNELRKDFEVCDKDLANKLLENVFDMNWPEIYGLLLKIRPSNPSYGNSVLRGQINRLVYIESVTLQLQGKNYSVGIDKIDHMFAHGNMYWRTIRKDPTLPKEKMIGILIAGVEQEHNVWGLAGTGQKSYGDLSANYQGIYFWRDVWDGNPTFFKCEKGKLILARDFKIEDYLTPAVDEAINCNSYENKTMAETIIARTVALGRKCPVDPETCKSLVETTPKEFQPYLLSPLCRGEISNQIEEKGSVAVKDLVDGFSGVTNLILPGKVGLEPDKQLKRILERRSAK